MYQTLDSLVLMESCLTQKPVRMEPFLPSNLWSNDPKPAIGVPFIQNDYSEMTSLSNHPQIDSTYCYDAFGQLVSVPDPGSFSHELVFNFFNNNSSQSQTGLDSWSLPQQDTPAIPQTSDRNFYLKSEPESNVRDAEIEDYNPHVPRNLRTQDVPEVC